MIGRLDWDDCDYCIHNDETTGDCAVVKDVDENIYTEYDYIYCGLYKAIKED